ncbi:MAG: NAD(P)-dependent oxidoreductase [Bacteroidetes bacterium]|nr:NAD(P)-dependent oxidoreductase [Bacteroidota bacterium]
MKILITGASGLIGSSLVNKITEGNEIFILNHNRKLQNEFSKKVKTIFCDLSEDWNVNFLPEKIDAIIHLAQSEHFREFPEKSEEIFRVNTLSTLKLLNYAKYSDAKKFIYASSGGIYGNNESGFNEDTPVVSNNDIGFYLSTKLCSEIIAENYNSFFDVITLRFFFVYGKNQKCSMLIPRLVDSVKQEKPIILQGKEGIKINPVHVEDAASAVIKTMALNGSHKINIAGPEILSIKQIAETIGGKLQKKPLFEIKNIESKNLIGDIGKMCKLLSVPKVNFSEGITALI